MFIQLLGEIPQPTVETVASAIPAGAIIACIGIFFATMVTLTHRVDNAIGNSMDNAKAAAQERREMKAYAAEMKRRQ